MEDREKPLSSNSCVSWLHSFSLVLADRRYNFRCNECTSKRFGWTVAQASSLVTVTGVMYMLLLLIIVAQLSSVLSRHLSLRWKDLCLFQ